MPFEKLTVKTGDNIELAAWWIRKVDAKFPDRRAILLLHGYHSSKEDLLSVAAFLYPDADVLMLDFRAHGESKGKFTTIGACETRDAKAAVAFLRKKNYKRIGIFGFSMGGAVALELCGERGIHAIVTDSAYANLGEMIESHYRFLAIPVLQSFASWTSKLLARIFFGIHPDRISPATLLRSCSVPVFAMHAAHDPLVPVSHAEEIKNALQGRKNSGVWIAGAYGHGTLHAVFGPAYENRVLHFFKRHL